MLLLIDNKSNLTFQIYIPETIRKQHALNEELKKLSKSSNDQKTISNSPDEASNENIFDEKCVLDFKMDFEDMTKADSQGTAMGIYLASLAKSNVFIFNIAQILELRKSEENQREVKVVQKLDIDNECRYRA